MLIIINYYSKFGSSLATIAKILQTNVIFLIHTHLFLGTLFFAGKKAPAGAARPSKRGWSYPITFRSLVVKHPAPTQNFDRNFDICLTYFGVVWEHLGCIQGVVRGRQEQLSSKIFPRFVFIQKVSGRVQNGPRSPPDNIKKY